MELFGLINRNLNLLLRQQKSCLGSAHVLFVSRFCFVFELCHIPGEMVFSVYDSKLNIFSCILLLNVYIVVCKKD